MCKDVKSQIPDSATAEAFSKFFTHKVESVRSATENAAPPSFSPCPKPCCFDTFQPLTPEQVSILIKRAPDKTSDLDPVEEVSRCLFIMLWPCLCLLITVYRRVQCWAQCCFCCTPLILWSWFVVLVCWPMPMLMICRYIVT